MSQPHSVLTDPVLGGLHAAMTASDSSVPIYRASLSVMGTRAHITTVGGSSDLPETISHLLVDLDRVWSRFRSGSDISQLNNASGQSLEVTPETLRLLDEMAWGYSRTRGSFDPTLLPSLVREGYSESLVTPGLVTELPASASLKGRMMDIEIDDSRVTLQRGTTIDSGGVGKGLAADMAVELAMAEGALGALVEVGGDLRVSGVSPRSDSWRLAIENPHDTAERLSIVELRSEGLATSTIVKRRFRVGERDTHHIIDPTTLRSAESDTIQASVIASSAARAEMWTKVAFVRGSHELLKLARQEGFEAACLLQDGQWVTSTGWPESDA